MKRRFISFLSAVVVAFMSFAQTSGTVVYSWESPEGTVIESGGTIAYVMGEGDRLNYSNAGYHTICLNGKKGNLADETASANAGRMVITLDEALQEGDSIYVTAYRNKNADGKAATIHFLYENGTVVNDTKTFTNICADDADADYDDDGAEPNTHGYLVPVEAAGSKTITLTRNSASTNLFITKFVIVRQAAEEDTPAEPELIVWTINPADYTAGVQYAVDEAHVVNDTLTIYTTQMHWTTQLRVYSSSEHNGYFYSNKLPAAIKSIEFTAGNKVDVLVVYGSNDGATWTEAAKVEVSSTSYTSGLVADLTGTAYNYFKVDVEGNQQIRISNLIITLDPSVELPKVVAAPSFSLSGCNLFAPATVELTAAEGTIYWSTDNENFVAYTDAIAIDATCTIYAYAEVEGSKSVVASAEYVMATTYDNVAALLAAEATSAGVPVIVKLKAVVDSLGLNKSGEVTSAFLIEGTDTLMIYDYNIPADYVVGNKVKGQLAGLWKDYKGTLELCNVDYSAATAVAPVTVESPWVGAVAEAGATYYLYNPAAKAFLKAGNSWGTRASFGQDAYPIILEGADNVYALSTTLAFAGKGLRASDLFMDQSLDKFTFEEVGNGIYTFSSGGKYVAYTGVNTVEYAAELNEGCYWQLLTADVIKEQMLVADENNPYDVTALIPGANFGRQNAQNSAWTGSPSIDGDVDNFCAEKWNAGISVVSQTLTGLPNGTYRLQAQGLYRMGGVDGSVALRDAGQEIYDVKFFANTDSVMVMSVMDEAGKLAGVGDAYGTYGTAPNNRNHASKFFNAGYYEHSLYFTVTDGTAVIGVANNTGVGSDWLVFDNFRMTYYGTASVEDVMLAVPRQEFVARYAAMEAFSQEELNYAWNGINNNYFWPVMDAAMAIKDTIDNVTDMALLDSMMTEMDNAEAMVLKAYVLGDEYNKVKNLFWDASDNSTAISDEARMAMEAALENSNYASYTIATIEDLEAAIVDLKAEYIAYVGNATPVEGFLFDVTCMFANPSFDAGNINGWTAAAGWQFQSNQVYTGEGAELNKFQERWVGGAGLGNTSTIQTLTNMPNGVYRISADIMATAQYDADPKGHTTGAYWVANADSVAVATANGTPERYTVETTVVDGNLTIGLVGVNTTANWMGLDNVVIEFCGVAVADPLAEKKAAFLERKNAFDVYSQESLNYTWNGINNNYFWPVSDAVYALADTLDNVTDAAILDQAMADMDNAEAMVEKAYVAGDRYNYFKELLWNAADNSTANSDEVRMALETVLESSNYASYTITTVEALEAATVELKDAYLAYIPNAWGNEEGVTFDVTFMAGLTPRAGDSYDAATDAWSASSTSANAPEVTTADGRTAPMIEYNTRVGKEKLNSVVMQQTVWNLPNGTYNVELYANALNNNYEVALTDGDNTLVYVSANDVKTPVVARNATAITESEVYAINGAVVTDGSLHLTLSKNDKDGTNWHTVQVKSISMVAPVKSTEECLKTIEVSLVDVKVGDWTAETIIDAAVMAEITELLGAKASELTYQLVDTTGVHSNYNGNPGEVLFWVDLEGNLSNWGVNNKFFLSYDSVAPAITSTQYQVAEGDVLNATVRLANAKGQYVEINITESIYVSPIINIADFDVVSTIKVEHNETVGVTYSGKTALFDPISSAAALGVASLADAEQYILNVTTGNLVANTTDGWRDANGDAAPWGAEGGVCVKIQDPASGSIDYIGCIDTKYVVGDVYTAKWAFVHEGKAVIVEVVITFVDGSGIANIEAAENAVIYTISGKRVQGDVKSLEKGIYIINGVKTLVK